jgi:TPR repeat protein
MKFTIPILALAALFAASGARADLDLIRHAAEAGNAEAQLELGILFQYGFNYKDNEVPALTWYTLAANQGNARAGKLREALMKKMTEKEVEEALEQVAQFKAARPAAPAAAPAPEPQPAPVETAPVAPAPSTEVPPAAEPAPAPAPQ